MNTKSFDVGYYTPEEWGYTTKDDKGEYYSFYGGCKYEFTVYWNDKAVHKTYGGSVTIPIYEFVRHFMREEDNFNKLEGALEAGSTCIGGNKNIYGVSLAPYRYRIFINAYPVKNDDGEWVLPEKGIDPKEPMFTFDTDAVGGGRTLDEHPDRPLLLGLEVKINALRDHQANRCLVTSYEAKLSRLATKIERGLTLNDYLKSLATRWFNYYHGSGQHASVTNITLGSYPKHVRIQFIRHLDGSRYGFTVEANEMVYFVDFKHEGKWKPWFYKKVNDHTACSI